MQPLPKFTLLFGLLVLFSACGQKGPIQVIPTDRTEAQVITDLEEGVDTKTTQTQEPELTR